MGEVWRAFDLKLRVDVALKALRAELLEHERARETLRQEVRAAREVISPNVCRVFDLLELDDRELVSMEYIDGTTLAGILRSRSPLELEEAREIASQFLAGLEAIHQAGLVHRDVKPENVMITRSGRVVVMDFGIAKGLAEARTGTVAGTPAYMAPEQERGEGVDARADVFSAGVVLAEMTAPEGIREREARLAVRLGVREEPPRLPETPWRAVLERAVARSPKERFASAAVLARALEEVTLRVEGAEDLRPYPGLAAFTEGDAEYFFGRELEVETMWKKLRRPHLLALIGPSGAGKSSFLRAGLLPSKPEGWGHVICTPGSAPVLSLSRNLARELAGDPEAVDLLLRFDDPETAIEAVSRWRRRHDQALVIVDQFEELFTLNPPEVQSRYADLLGRLALEADAHVLLSMRDDFLFRCHVHEGLRPILSELTLLGPPTGAALRRAVVQPALKCGYRFEDEGLVEEMAAEVSEERGALPLVAFAAARLWERRDREQGLLTREAYEAIGGVGGALAQHAEATLEQIGSERIPIAREIFRNLVTAQGTRAARDREELLSVFGGATAEYATTARLPVASQEAGVGSPSTPASDVPDLTQPSAEIGRGQRPPAVGDRGAAEEVLDALIDARLLTSFEVPAAEGETSGHHRIEIIHESLLSAWPRLVRWQTQDAEGAHLRDELRQAAQMWDQHDRSEDFLWTGTAFREFQLWRERYPGGLTASEEAFAEAMERYAWRRRRRRRLAVAAVIVILLGVLAVVGTLWRQSDHARREAQAEARRAEASKLLALGRLELDEYPTGALAYALASLELADQEAARIFALEALYRGPVAIRIDEVEEPSRVDFSPDGQWLAVSRRDGAIELWSPESGEVRVLREHDGRVNARFGPDSELLVSVGEGDKAVRVWSTSTGRLLRSIDLEGPSDIRLCALSREILAVTKVDDDRLLRIWSLDGGEPRTVGRRRLGTNKKTIGRHIDVDPTCTRLAYGDGSSLRVLPIDRLRSVSGRTVGAHEANINHVVFSPDGERLACADEDGQIRLWPLAGESAASLRTFQGQKHWITSLRFDGSGSRLAAASVDETVRVWDLTGPPEAAPLVLRSNDAIQVPDVALNPDGRWAASAEYYGGVALWSLLERYPRVLSGHTGQVSGLAMAPDGTWMATSSWDGTVRIWPLSGESGSRRLPGVNPFYDIAAHPDGRWILGAFTALPGTMHLLPVGPGRTRTLEGFSGQVWTVAVSPNGRLVAAGGGQFVPQEAIVRVWNLEDGEVDILDAGDGKWISELQFVTDDRLVVASGGGIRLWNLEDRTFRTLRHLDDRYAVMALSRDGRFLVSGGYNLETLEGSVLLWQDLETGAERSLDVYGYRNMALAFGNDESTLLAGDNTGVVRVGPVTGEEPHLLLHSGHIWRVAATPDDRWIVATGAAGTVRLWPMPDLDEPPFHTLPYDELLERLRALTNLRAVEDADSPTGYSLEAEPFTGWRAVPTW
jgi:WD40 repeat protein